MGMGYDDLCDWSIARSFEDSLQMRLRVFRSRIDDRDFFPPDQIGIGPVKGESRTVWRGNAPDTLCHFNRLAMARFEFGSEIK